MYVFTSVYVCMPANETTRRKDVIIKHHYFVFIFTCNERTEEEKKWTFNNILPTGAI